MIVLLNGCSSSGKTSIVRAMQHLNQKAFFRVGLDTFIYMMPRSFFGSGPHSAEGFLQKESTKNGYPSIETINGYWGEKIVQTIPQTVRFLHEKGFDLIVDEVILGSASMQYYLDELKDLADQTFFVKIFCELEILKEREVLRGDRRLGIANWQFDIVHHPSFVYDFEVDTSRSSIFEVAKKVMDQTGSNPSGFKKMLAGRTS